MGAPGSRRWYRHCQTAETTAPVDLVVVLPGDRVPVDQRTNFGHHRKVTPDELLVNGRLGDVAYQNGSTGRERPGT